MKYLIYTFSILTFFISCKENKKVNTEINQIKKQDVFRYSITYVKDKLTYNITSSKNNKVICKINLQEEPSLLSISYIKKSLKNDDFDNDGNIESIFATVTEGDGETYHFNINYINDCKLLSFPIELSYQNENNIKQITSNFIKLINSKGNLKNDVKIEIKKYFNHTFQNKESFDYENIENSKKTNTISSYINKWKGTYNLKLEGLVHMDESHNLSYVFKIKNNPTIITQLDDNPKKNINCKILKASKDTLFFQEKNANQKSEYKLFKNQQGDYIIGGHSIYMINPPNTSYTITKE